MAQRTILVADDDASIRSLLKQLLSDEGYSVVEATTGTEVVEKVKDVNPDLVIMDVRMPELDGIEALSKLRVSSPKTSVLIMTAFGGIESEVPGERVEAISSRAWRVRLKLTRPQEDAHAVPPQLLHAPLEREVCCQGRVDEG